MRSRDWPSIGVHVDLRRLGRLVRPRQAAAGRPVRLRLPVPALLVSPYAKRGYVDHTTLDATSILKFIEQNWGLRPLASRDGSAQSIAGAFDFALPPRQAAFVGLERRGSQGRPAAPLGGLRLLPRRAGHRRGADRRRAGHEPPADRRRGRRGQHPRGGLAPMSRARSLCVSVVAVAAASIGAPGAAGTAAALAGADGPGRGDDHPGDAEPQGRVARTGPADGRAGPVAPPDPDRRPAHRRDVRRRRAAGAPRAAHAGQDGRHRELRPLARLPRPRAAGVAGALLPPAPPLRGPARRRCRARRRRGRPVPQPQRLCALAARPDRVGAGTRVVAYGDHVAVKNVEYSVDDARVQGLSVVNRAQQRFVPAKDRRVGSRCCCTP